MDEKNAQRLKNPKENKYTKEFLNQVKKLYEEGNGIRKIVKKLNKSRYIVKTALTKLGIIDSNRQNLRKNHLITERYCPVCKKIRSISEFSPWITQDNLLQYKYCKNCTKEKNNFRLLKRYHKIKNNLEFRIMTIVSSHIKIGCKENRVIKNQRCSWNFLPYTPQELRKHIEKQFDAAENLTPDGKIWMNWDNWGVYCLNTWNDNDPNTWVWNLDHIIPKSDLKFSDLNDENFLKCWDLNNLRPYSAKQNVLDGVKRTRHKEK